MVERKSAADATAAASMHNAAATARMQRALTSRIGRLVGDRRSRRGRSRLLHLLYLLLIDCFEIDRRKMDGRKAGADDGIGNGLARVRKEDRRAGDTEERLQI